ncbi:MAG: MFS transporter, partial [Halobacteriaceae archaeon]
GAASVLLAAPAQAAFAPATLAGFGRSVVLQPAVVVLFLVYGLLGVADSVRLPASMALFVEEGEPHDAVAASFSLRSLSWKAGHLAGPLAAGAAKDAFGTPAAFVVAAGFVLAGVVAFVALQSRGRSAPAPAPGD